VDIFSSLLGAAQSLQYLYELTTSEIIDWNEGVVVGPSVEQLGIREIWIDICILEHNQADFSLEIEERTDLQYLLHNFTSKDAQKVLPLWIEDISQEISHIHEHPPTHFILRVINLILHIFPKQFEVIYINIRGVDSIINDRQKIPLKHYLEIDIPQLTVR
jgi:hypothetical protein